MSPISIKPLETLDSGETQREFVGRDKLGEVVMYGYLNSDQNKADVHIVVQDGDENAGYVRTYSLEHDSLEDVRSLMENFSEAAAEVATAIFRSKASDKMIARKLRSI